MITACRTDHRWNKQLRKIISRYVSNCFAVAIHVLFYFVSPPAAYFAHFFISPRASFDMPWQWLRSINHPFPWTVSACLLWDETTAISSSAPPTPALFFCLAFLPKPPTPSNRTQFSAFQTIWFVFRQSTETESVMLIKDDMRFTQPMPGSDSTQAPSGIC